eukprot:CAMPEP_0181397706 /NCGR_PEP_ID=MMETSP1110-20121109/637_1 /TAXON_ID=174948 /ORGANISM="Symbiodinium sp., Strain CCMP421" /LENGTH=81 /DNA_ID=CAMNT_0023519581 /DNA_START=157 /DNA_END=402 /DNA_ORIENTATION=-
MEKYMNVHHRIHARKGVTIATFTTMLAKSMQTMMYPALSTKATSWFGAKRAHICTNALHMWWETRKAMVENQLPLKGNPAR